MHIYIHTHVYAELKLYFLNCATQAHSFKREQTHKAVYRYKNKWDIYTKQIHALNIWNGYSCKFIYLMFMCGRTHKFTIAHTHTYTHVTMNIFCARVTIDAKRIEFHSIYAYTRIYTCVIKLACICICSYKREANTKTYWWLSILYIYECICLCVYAYDNNNSVSL